MIENKKILAVIPARGGSKGVPKKNIKLLNGIPLIAYSILEAKKCKFITELCVSTDSEEIAEVAKKYDANVPFLRPAELATDSALSIDTIKHALEFYRKKGSNFDYVVLLQPTTPFRTAKVIDDAIEKLHATGCDSIVSMVDVGANHPARMYNIQNDKLVSIMDEGISMRPRQELPPVYIRSGDIYAATKDTVEKFNSMMGKDCRPVFVDPKNAVNIDNMMDFKIAELLMKQE